MDRGRRISKYQFAASFHDGLVAWSLTLELENGEQVLLSIEDGEEVPILLDVCRKEAHAFYDPATRTLNTGWNEPGKGT
jgi:hypothetical protein